MKNLPGVLVFIDGDYDGVVVRPAAVCAKGRE